MVAYSSMKEILEAFAAGTISTEEAVRQLNTSRFEELGGVARLDTGRSVRCGMPETVLAEGKDPAHLLEILCAMTKESGRCLATRLSREIYDELLGSLKGAGYATEYNATARTLVVHDGVTVPKPNGGVVGLLTAGTADISVAEEARVVAMEMGCETHVAYDVGAAGIHRLFPALCELQDSDVYVVAAGREGTLPAIVAGLVDVPVIGVPVSTGYGFMGQGEAALASMLQSCSVLTVVNIDAGFIAGAFAARIASMVGGK